MRKSRNKKRVGFWPTLSEVSSDPSDKPIFWNFGAEAPGFRERNCLIGQSVYRDWALQQPWRFILYSINFLLSTGCIHFYSQHLSPVLFHGKFTLRLPLFFKHLSPRIPFTACRPWLRLPLFFSWFTPLGRIEYLLTLLRLPPFFRHLSPPNECCIVSVCYVAITSDFQVVFTFTLTVKRISGCCAYLYFSGGLHQVSIWRLGFCSCAYLWFSGTYHWNGHLPQRCMCCSYLWFSGDFHHAIRWIEHQGCCSYLYFSGLVFTKLFGCVMP